MAKLISQLSGELQLAVYIVFWGTRVADGDILTLSRYVRWALIELLITINYVYYLM